MDNNLKQYQPNHNETYMNQQQQDYFYQKLISWREQLLEESHQSLQRIRNGEQRSGDIIDRSVHDSNKVFNFITKRRNEMTVQKINAALKRLDNGTFGYCLESGEEIGIDRLIAYPIATLAVELQEFIERRSPRPAVSTLAM